MNSCMFLGRWASDLELKYSSNGDMAICRGRLAVNRRYKRNGEPDADFINMVSFGKTAENIHKFFEKGAPILVETHVQTGSYENREGRKIYTTDFIIDNFDFVQSKQEKAEKPALPDAPEGEFMPVPEGEDTLPW